MSFLTWLSRKRFPYEPLVTIEISRSRLIHNLNEFRKVAPSGHFAPVIKSNAYGHGLAEIAHIIRMETDKWPKHERPPFYVVDSYFEALALRSGGFKPHILIMGYTRPETMTNLFLRGVSFTVTSLQSLEALSQADFAPRGTVRIHLKIDTGMRRQGILPHEAVRAIDLLKGHSHIVLEGLCTHFADADNVETSFTEGQIQIWNELVQLFESSFPGITHIHASNSDGHRYVSMTRATVSRLGIGLYGLIDTIPASLNINPLPVLEMKTIITGTKHLRAGDHVGYGNTFRAEKDMTIATIPVGYYEGVDRRLSNSGYVEAGTDLTPCKIIGRVSMNITVIDVSALKDACIGTPVTVISRDPSKKNSLHSIAAICKTIVYEQAVRIPPHLKRIIVD